MEIATISSILTPLAFLACPVGMGAMMWMMMRGNRSRPNQQPTQSHVPVAETSPHPSLEVLREEHQRLGQQIERLDSGRRATAVGYDEQP
ncbi:hypothetical protein [Conexibacter sp. DBS9H8]|uniref:hypothetical protein n=1 Tax=Conexibacter sp. DBS9H8 TaxID=2937801 RepID=UPI00200E639F|nr:hypothetical protein [Conexibacter sp. DBS9H8]